MLRTVLLICIAVITLWVLSSAFTLGKGAKAAIDPAQRCAQFEGVC